MYELTVNTRRWPTAMRAYQLTFTTVPEHFTHYANGAWNELVIEITQIMSVRNHEISETVLIWLYFSLTSVDWQLNRHAIYSGQLLSMHTYEGTWKTLKKHTQCYFWSYVESLWLSLFDRLLMLEETHICPPVFIIRKSPSRTVCIYGKDWIT